MQLPEEYDRSARKLILLNHNTAVLLNLFYMDKEDEFETIVYDEISPDYAWRDIHKEAADEFVKQLRDNACPYFLKCLAADVMRNIRSGRKSMVRSIER